jgi:TonB family protein
MNGALATSPFGLFVLISVVWHCLQLALFTWVFNVQAPQTSPGAPRRLEVQVLSQGPALQGTVLIERQKSQQTPFYVDHKKVTRPPELKIPPASPTPLSMERLTPLEKPRETDPLSPTWAPQDISQKPELSRSGVLPFKLKGELQLRQVVSTPRLPQYPEWALLAAVELSLKVSLEVDPNGYPHRVYIMQSSGDSQTDISVLEYVEKMRFEASLTKSFGVMEWAFRLQP